MPFGLDDRLGPEVPHCKNQDSGWNASIGRTALSDLKRREEADVQPIAGGAEELPISDKRPTFPQWRRTFVDFREPIAKERRCEQQTEGCGR